MRMIDYRKKQVRMYWKLWKAGLIKEDDIPEPYKKLVKKWYLDRG